jgi:hypothetical protein
MAHWARINSDNIVEEVIVTSNDEADEGESWIAESLEGTWLKTSYNTRKGKHIAGGIPLRANFAMPGSTYNAEHDVFIPPKFEGQENFILDQSFWGWVPQEVPADAKYVMPYGPQPDKVEKIIPDKDGNSVTRLVSDIKDDDNVYLWVEGETSGWWLNPNINYPKPNGDFYWDGFSKTWSAIPEQEAQEPN